MAGLRSASWLAALVLTAVVASIASELLIPLILAALLAILLRPLVRGLEKLRVPPYLGALVVVAGTSAILIGTLQLAQGPATRVLEDLPRAAARVADELHALKRSMGDGNSFSQTMEVFEDFQDGAGSQLQRVQIEPVPLDTQLLSIGATVVVTGLGVVLLVYFFLVHGDTLFRRLIEITPTLTDKKRTVEIVRAVQSDASRYLLTITVINIGLALAVAGALWALGVENAVFWGLVAGTLNFVPYLGAAIVTGALLLVGFGDPANVGPIAALTPAIVYMLINAVEANGLTPWLLGRQFAINPLVILIWLMLWGWLWGVPGVLLGVPMLVCAKVVLSRVERFQAWAVLMGDRETLSTPLERSTVS